MFFFNLYGHGKLEFKFVHGRAGKQVGGHKICPKRCTHQMPKLQKKMIEPRVFREKSSFSCRHICLGKQLLPQINICCREVMRYNKMTSSMVQPLLDACSILEKRLPSGRVGFEF